MLVCREGKARRVGHRDSRVPPGPPASDIAAERCAEKRLPPPQARRGRTRAPSAPQHARTRFWTGWPDPVQRVGLPARARTVPGAVPADGESGPVERCAEVPHGFSGSRVAWPIGGATSSACSRALDVHTFRIGPGYRATMASVVRSVIPSSCAWATRMRSKGSLWMWGRRATAVACAPLIGNSV